MSLAGWHSLDIFFIILGCYFIIRGCFRGFIGELITLAGYVCAMYVSFKFSSRLGAVISGVTGTTPSVSQLIAIVIVWLGITLIVALLRRIMKKLLAAVSLGGLDRILGVVSGLIKTFITVYVVMVAGLLLAPVFNPTWMTESDILRYAGRQWPEVRQILIDFSLLPAANDLPDGTLEQILRPYRTGGGSPSE